MNLERRIDGGWGWVIVAAAFMLMLLSYGNGYTFGAYFSTLAAEFDADRADTSFVFSIIAALYSSLAIIAGPASDKFGTRPVCLFGMVVMAAGLFYAANATTLSEIYVGFGLGVAIGIGTVFAPASAGVQRWFVQRRGLASGISTTGVGLAIIALPPLNATLIDLWGWRTAMMLNGTVVLVIGGLAAYLMTEPPHPVSDDQTSLGQRTRGTYRLRSVFLSRGYVFLHLSSMCCCVGIFIPFVHLPAFTKDLGLGEETGVVIISIIGLASIVGRVALAAASDHIPRRNALVLMYFMMGAGLVLWYFGDSMGILIGFAILFGVGYGGYVAMIGPMAGAYFGTAKIGTVIGVLLSSIAIGGSLGPWFAGYTFDQWGSYDMSILIAAGFGLLATVIGCLIPATPDPEETYYV